MGDFNWLYFFIGFSTGAVCIIAFLICLLNKSLPEDLDKKILKIFRRD